MTANINYQASNLMVVAGEASGDMHGASVIREIKKLIPNLNCFGIGGNEMQRTGVDIHTNISELSVVGLFEVLKHYPRLRTLLTKTKQTIIERHPDLLILIDSPDFNLPLAKTAKKHGIKVLYYISPQIWAWRKSRIKFIKKYVDMMAVVFPFEEKFYRDAGVPVEYVGHPLIKHAKYTIDRNQFFNEYGFDLDKKLIGLFPGSRVSEIENNYPVLLDAAEKLSRGSDDIYFITPLAPTIQISFIQKYISSFNVNVKIVQKNIYDVINACDAIAAASGTVTLQITLMQTPMLIIYKVSPITYRILNKIVNFTYAGIANVIANEEIIREFIQNDATTENIVNELQKLLSEKNYIDKMKKNMSAIRDLLGEKDGSEATARLAVKLLAGK